ncbi:MAG: hypothetical protein ACI82F_004230 [Planctomycetota bacterium]|jgi:hypothetical protein
MKIPSHRPIPIFLGFLGATALTGLLSAQGLCQTQKLTANNAVVGDFLGKSVDIDGTTAVAGMYALLNAANSGRVYVYEDQGGTWIEVAQLTQSDATGAPDEFGNSVGVSGDVIVVGAEFNDNDLGNNAGAIYIFEEIGGVWAETAKLTASDGASNMHFGENVAVSGATVVVGQRENGSLGNNAGAVFVFEKVGGVWTETAKLLASDGDKNALLGDTVAIDGTTIVAGSYKADAGGVNGPGACYVFENIGGLWVETQKLAASDLAGGGFGRSVNIEGDTIVVGTWKDGSQISEGGSAYVFEDQGGVWIEVAKLLPSNPMAGAWVGHSVGISGDSIVLSAHKFIVGGTAQGGAYLFQDNGSGWNEVTFFQSNDISAKDQFGQWVAIDGDNMIIGAPFDGGSRGSAYMFEVNCTQFDGTFVPYGIGLGGANIGSLVGVGIPNPGANVSFDVTMIPNGGVGYIWYAPTQFALPFRGGTLLADLTNAYRVTPISLTNGATQVPLSIPSNLPGLVAYVQAATFDTTQPQGIAFTNGVIMAVGQ